MDGVCVFRNPNANSIYMQMQYLLLNLIKYT